MLERTSLSAIVWKAGIRTEEKCLEARGNDELFKRHHCLFKRAVLGKVCG